MPYRISEYTKEKAKTIGVEVKPSKDKAKKIDVYKKGQLVASVGASGYKDYPTYLKEKGKDFADERRRLYKLRHVDRNKKDTPSYYADKLLW